MEREEEIEELRRMAGNKEGQDPDDDQEYGSESDEEYDEESEKDEDSSNEETAEEVTKSKKTKKGKVTKVKGNEFRVNTSYCRSELELL
jgi:hypothetical protein